MNQHQILKKYILGLSKGYANSLIVCSPAGYGKTETTLKMMDELGLKENEHYLYYANYITPKALVGVLEGVNDLKDPKLLILDDPEDTLRNLQAIGVFKGALWEANGKRKVFWTTSKEMIEFEFEGRIIFLLNQINKKNSLINALRDRGFYYEMNLTIDEMMKLMETRAKADYHNIPYNKRREIVQYLQKVGNKSSNISLRLLPKAYNLFLLSPNHWQELVAKLV